MSPGCWIFPAAFLCFLVIISDLPVSTGLQCYNCRGITNYDPNSCFNPVFGKTVTQECAKNEVCEKRVTMVDRLQDVIDRGCSSNCQSRKFIWTDEFQVYCCNDATLCNEASSRVFLSTINVCVMIFIGFVVRVFL